MAVEIVAAESSHKGNLVIDLSKLKMETVPSENATLKHLKLRTRDRDRATSSRVIIRPMPMQSKARLPKEKSK